MQKAELGVWNEPGCHRLSGTHYHGLDVTGTLAYRAIE